MVVLRHTHTLVEHHHLTHEPGGEDEVVGIAPEVGASRKAVTALVYQGVVAGVASTIAVQGDTGALIAIQATALNTDNVIFNAALVFANALGGGLTYFEVGNYNTSDPIDFPGNNLTLAGTGRGSFINGDGLATTEHAVEITGRTDCVLRDFSVQTEDGSGKDSNCINIDSGSHRFLVENITIVNSSRDGINVGGTSTEDGMIINNRILAADDDGINPAPSDPNIFTNFLIMGNIGTATGHLLRFSNVICLQFKIIGNTAIGCGDHGYFIRGLRNDADVEGYTVIADNMAFDNAGDGMRVNNSSEILFSNNICSRNLENGMYLQMTVIDSILTGNICNENDTDDTGTFSGIQISSASSDNLFTNNICNDNDLYGINITHDTCLRNLVKNNILRGNTTAPFNDLGTDTKLATISGEFPLSNVGGGAAAVAPVINTSPGGVDIDAADEFAHAKIPLPTEVQQIVRIKIWAYSNVIEATNNMLLRIVAHGAGSSELWSGNAIDVVDHPSEETGGIVQYDVLHWIIAVGDDAQVGTLAAQDLVELLAVGEGASAPDIATDAYFGGYNIEYV